jgi:hypothetical protein
MLLWQSSNLMPVSCLDGFDGFDGSIAPSFSACFGRLSLIYHGSAESAALSGRVFCFCPDP